MIERSQQILLEALKASLFGAKPSYPDDADWDEVVREAEAQTLTGLISTVIPEQDEFGDQNIISYTRILHEQDKVIRLLEENGIPCVILKGCAAAVYYPEPYLRTMGDIDILVPRDRFAEAVKLMDSKGYVYTYGKDREGRLLKNARHIVYYMNGVEIELHHHFSTQGFDADDILEAAIERRVYRELSGYSFPTLPDVENGLVLLGHINQHIRENTLGLRQIIDWEMFFNSVMDSEMWKNEFGPLAGETGLLKLAYSITKLCEKQLGLPKSLRRKDHTEEDISEELLTNLLTYGNFGLKQPASAVNSGENIQLVICKIKSKGLFRYFQDNGLETWKLCRKYPALRPFAFIYGILRFISRGTKGIFRTGNVKEQVRYVRDKNDFQRKVGIKTH